MDNTLSFFLFELSLLDQDPKKSTNKNKGVSDQIVLVREVMEVLTK